MYKPSDAYKAHIQANTTRVARSKIVVDGVEYTGRDTLKTPPQITYDADFYGSFPAKTCTFELFNKANIKLVGKEVAVYRGLDFDGKTEWVPIGVFIATAADIQTSQSGNSITYLGYDRAIYFDVPFEPVDVTYPITIGAWVQEMAMRRGVGFSSTPFPCCDIILTGPPAIAEGTTEREVIRQIAELGGCNAYISRTGELIISQPANTGATIPRRLYQSLSGREERFGGINAVVVVNDAPPDDSEIIDTDETPAEVPQTTSYTHYDNEAIAAANGEVIAMTLTNNVFAGTDQQGFAEYIAETYIFLLR